MCCITTSKRLEPKWLPGQATGFEGHLECPEFPVTRHVTETSEATGFEGHLGCPEIPVTRNVAETSEGVSELHIFYISFAYMPPTI